MGAEMVARGRPGDPRRGIIDSGEAAEGALFFGLRGQRVDGGEFAAAAIAAGAWGVGVSPERATGLEGAWVFAVADPLAALQGLASAWRHRLGVPVVGITGSGAQTPGTDIGRAPRP